MAAFNRTPERVMMAAALGLLLAGQATVILGGTLGFFPLTGVVVPFLSAGKTGTVALTVVVALLVRLGEDALFRADTDELRELRLGVHQVRGALVLVALALAWGTGIHAIWGRDDTTLRGVVTTLGDGTPVMLHDPRLRLLAKQVRRGSILDRDGAVLAASPAAGERVNPLGEALGTVLGTSETTLGRARWQIERQLDARLRGWPDRPTGPSVWLATVRGERQAVFAVEGGELTIDAQRAIAATRAVARGAEGDVTRVILPDPDLSPLLPIARLGLAERTAAIQTLADDVDARSVRLTLDAELQAGLAKAVRKAAAKSEVGVAAAVIVDASSGEILARAQWPDFDPGGTAWRPLRAADEAKFMGVYGPWSDKTGAHGVYQAGSVFKTLSALVAVREGVVSADVAADGCTTHALPEFPVDQKHDGRPSFVLPGWSRPIHDHGDGGATGRLDLVSAIGKSSNVYFGQLALKLGPEAYRRLREAGVEFGNASLLAETDGPFTGLGEGGSRRLAQTGFGQGAGSWSVVQAARLVAAVANGGTYLRCDPSMELGLPCESLALLPPGASVEPILAGMRAVMTSGTGAKLPKVDGVRVYGKTGTADAPGTRDEKPWGIRPGETTRPHSWFVAIAEGETAPVCASSGARVVVAAVVPHGGFGASSAGPLAVDAVRLAQGAGYLPAPAP